MVQWFPPVTFECREGEGYSSTQRPPPLSPSDVQGGIRIHVHLDLEFPGCIEDNVPGSKVRWSRVLLDHWIPGFTVFGFRQTPKRISILDTLPSPVGNTEVDTGGDTVANTEVDVDVDLFVVFFEDF